MWKHAVNKLKHLCMIGACLTFVALSGCGKGIDKSLVTDKGAEAYRASLNEAWTNMTGEEQEAFNWAVSDLNIELLNQRYPNATPKEVIRGEVKKVLKGFPDQIAELEKLRPQYDTVLAEIGKISASDVRFSLGRDFFGVQPIVRAKVSNQSGLAISTMQWSAELYIDGKSEPVAQARLLDSYETASVGESGFGARRNIQPGGLAPGGTAMRQFNIGFVSGDRNWSTIEIQNAREHIVKLHVIPESIKDYGNREYLHGAPYQQIESLKGAIQAAERFEKI